MLPTALIPWLDPATIIPGLGPWALIGVCAIIFAETGLLIGFLFPGDTLLFFTGLLTFSGVIDIDVWWVAIAIGISAFLGGEVGYLIGNRVGPRIFERKESGVFSIKNVQRTNAFFVRFGGIAVILARFVPVVRTFAPVAAGVGHMNYRRYSIYNFVGAILWGVGVTMAGFLLGRIPWVHDFATNYIDLVLIAAVVVTIIPALVHYLRSVLKAKNAAKAADADAAGPATEPVKLDEEVFNRRPQK